MRRLIFVVAALLAAAGCQAADDGPLALPESGWLVWDSDRADGRHEIYLMPVADGTAVTRLTHSGGKHPTWSPDGDWIAYHHTPDDSVHVVHWNGTGDKQICATSIRQSNGGYLPPFWLHNKSGLLCREGDGYFAVDPWSGARKPLFKHSDFQRLSDVEFTPGSISRDGRWVLGVTDRFRQGYTASNGSYRFFWAAFVVDLMDPGVLYFMGPGCEPITAPSGDLAYHVCGYQEFCPHGFDIARLKLGDLPSRASYQPEIAYPDEQWGHEYFPRISNDNKWLTYGASQGCHDHDLCDYEIFIHPLGVAGSRARLSEHPGGDRWPHLWVGSLPL